MNIDFGPLIQEMSERGRDINEGDYIKDGLYHCKVCHKPKQCHIDIPDENGNPKDYIVNCICDCRKAQMQADEERLRQERKERIRNEAFPSERMKEWTFDNDDGNNEKLTAGLKRYVENFQTFRAEGKGLLLYGSTGTGKSYAAAQIVNALIDKGYKCRFTSIIDIVQRIQSDWNDDILDELCSCALVVLDDLSAERKTEYMQENVYNIIDHLNKAYTPVIVTTNLSKEQLRGAEDITFKRTYSRIAEMCHPILVDGADRRKSKATDTYKATKDILGI